MYSYFFNTNILLHSSWCFVDHLKNRKQHWGNCTCVKSSWFLRCHRNVTKKTNPLYVHKLNYKSVAISEASRRIMNTQCVKNSVLWKIFKNMIHISIASGRNQRHVVVQNSIPLIINVKEDIYTCIYECDDTVSFSFLTE